MTILLLLLPRKLNEISRLAVEPMFDDEKRKIAVHRAVQNHMVEANMTMILMMTFLEREIREVSRIYQTFDNLLTCSRRSP